MAIVTGVVLYAPFMRKLAFGEVRRDRSPRIQWLDLHNLLGIATLVWALVVGATGMINTWAALLVSQPLHFGDYGGLPMKLLWALLDIATIVVLGSGLYLWLKRRHPRALADAANSGTAP